MILCVFLPLLCQEITLQSFQLRKHWDWRLQGGPWDVIGGAQANRGQAFFFCEIASVLGTVNWGAEKWFRRGNGLKVTFWWIRRQNYISLLSPLSFMQWHEMNWWDGGRGKCQCKCLQLKWSCLLVHSDWLKGGRRKLEWEYVATLHAISRPKPLIAAATMDA